MNRTFPNIEFSTWQRCEQFLPHAQACAELIKKWVLEFPEAARLLNRAGLYLHERASYAEAEPRYQRALAIWEQALGPTHPAVATILENYANLLRKTNRDAEAETMEARAKATRAKHAQENLVK